MLLSIVPFLQLSFVPVLLIFHKVPFHARGLNSLPMTGPSLPCHMALQREPSINADVWSRLVLTCFGSKLGCYTRVWPLTAGARFWGWESRSLSLCFWSLSNFQSLRGSGLLWGDVRSEALIVHCTKDIYLLIYSRETASTGMRPPFNRQDCLITWTFECLIDCTDEDDQLIQMVYESCNMMQPKLMNN